jgi:hypothetical protein
MKAYASAALGMSVAVFTALIGYAIARYPGGTWADHETFGYDPLHNFICDLLEPIAIDGRPNGGQTAALVAVLALSIGLFVAWWTLPSLFAGNARLGLAVRALGATSTLGILAVPVMPARSWYWSHAAAVLFAGASGLAAAAVSVVALGRTRDMRVPARLGALLVVVVLVDVALYVHQLVVVGNPSIWLSLLEGVATALLLAWLLVLAVRLKKSSG